MAELEPLEDLLTAKSGRESSAKWKTVTFVLLAVYLLGTAGWQIWNAGFSSRAVTNLFLGVCSLVVTRFEKKMYVSPLGIVKETRTWFSHHREILRWEEIRHITLMIRGERMMAFLERDALGWKVPFLKSDMPKMDGIIKQYAPRVPVRIDNSAGRR